MFSGSLGEPEGGWPKDVEAVVLRGGTAKPGRPGEHLSPVDLAATQMELSEKIAREATHTDLMSYLMYPEVFLQFAKAQDAYNDLAFCRLQILLWNGAAERNHDRD